jgi:hypothetical protein
MVIALTISLMVFGAALPLLQMQARSVAAHAGRADASFTAQYGVNTIDRELRMAGAGVADAQPMLVYAGPRSVTFNANLVTQKGDPTAVYADPDADPNAVVGLLKSRAVTLPLSGVTYPDTNYTLGAQGGPTLAETVSYWVEPDPNGTRADQQILWRRVNDQAPQPLAKGVVAPSSQPVFRYYGQDSTGRPYEIAGTQLPLFHSAPVHSVITGARPDTGNSARTDSVRAVGVRIVALYRDTRKGIDVLDTAEVRIRLMNSGLNRVAACGERPRLTGALKATGSKSGGVPTVRLTWDASVDELTGEQDVERYLVLRRTLTGEFTEPIAVVPAGAATHTFVDSSVKSGAAWVYGVAAQDCTPSTSVVVSAPIVVVP